MNYCDMIEHLSKLNSCDMFLQPSVDRQVDDGRRNSHQQDDKEREVSSH